MPVVCKICNQEFASMITSTHLATHNVTTADYKVQHGKHSVSSPEFRARRSQERAGANNPMYGLKHSSESKQRVSQKNQGKTPWNKGLALEDTTKVKQAAQKREAKYQAGDLTRKPVVHSHATKKKISDSVKTYAHQNKDALKNRAKKALDTKLAQGKDLAFFKGKTHTAEAKAKISASSQLVAKRKSRASFEKAKKNAELAQCEIVGITDERYDIQCLVCESRFSFTKQYLAASGKFHTTLCPVCYPREKTTSVFEDQVAEYLKGLGLDIQRNVRTLLPSGKELDIVISDKQVAIETSGVYWHSELVLKQVGYSATKDYEKWQECQSIGVQLITIYDDEWTRNQDLVKSRLRSLAGINQRLFARQCIVKNITSKVANQFLNNHHLQGSGRSNVCLGLFHNSELVSVMTFSRENISRRINGWEINRFCQLSGITVVGGASKLFKHFVDHHNPDTVISYSDNRWGSGRVYQHLGMKKQHETKPNYWYFKSPDCKRYHRFSKRKNADDDPLLTEWENRQAQGWNRIWDCGNTKWIYSK